MQTNPTVANTFFTRNGSRSESQANTRYGSSAASANAEPSKQTNPSWVPNIVGPSFMGRLHGDDCLTKDGLSIDSTKCKHEPGETIKPLRIRGCRVLVHERPEVDTVIVARDSTWKGTDYSSSHVMREAPDDDKVDRTVDGRSNDEDDQTRDEAEGSDCDDGSGDCDSCQEMLVEGQKSIVRAADDLFSCAGPELEEGAQKLQWVEVDITLPDAR